MVISLILSAIIVLFDQLTKFLIYGTASRSIIGNFLWFTSTPNTGVAFGLFSGNSWIFIITSLIASGFLIWLVLSKKFFVSKFEKFTLATILGGTISNVIDRIIFGYVRDFIYLKFINFAIFNIADMAITIGAILLCVGIVISSFKTHSKEEK